ncbi:MAG TPA: hormogonium polysaccharide biosynthesis protein HpsA [Waterburya sp.]|jgi:Tfp pilus assembly protein PilX
MSTRKKPRNFFQRLPRRIWRLFSTVTKSFINWVLRSLMVFKRRSRQSQAGFVLPTVVMVLLVVALLTTAIVIRSFDRAKNASNYRVNEAVINAAKPALDRSRAKIDRLFSTEENRLSGSTPPESGGAGSIEDVLNQADYTFGDETRLKIVATDKAGTKQNLTTVWKFPTDTDNNGKFDSYTLYGIYFRNPSAVNGKETRPRTPIEARGLPQATGEIGGCEAGSGGGAEDAGWYETSGQLKKAFFTYVASVPISQTDIGKVPAADQVKYEPYKGKQGFSALEMQQDQARFALDNNAVWYDDDLVIANVPTLRLNGRMHTNSNLMLGNSGSEDTDSILLYQVSSVYSCYYKPENAKIIVGGNVSAGDVTGDTNGSPSDADNDLVKVDLYKGTYQQLGGGITNTNAVNQDSVNKTNKTTKQNPPQVASNSNAYAKRLKLLVDAALYKYDGGNIPKDVTDAGVKAAFPDEVYTSFHSKFDSTNPGSARTILTRALESYFANRIRRVSYIEVPFGTDPLGTYTVTNVLSATFEPPAPWTSIATTDSKIDVNISGAQMKLDASNPLDTNNTAKIEYNLGDRILVGNALPRVWKKADGTVAKLGDHQDITSVNWNRGGGQRYRVTRVKPVDDLGDTSRGGYWERAASLTGPEFQGTGAELAGGLRVITGAGIYIDDQTLGASVGTGQRGINSFLPAPPSVQELIAMQDKNPKGLKLPSEIVANKANTAKLADYRVVWPDSMPMYRWDDIGTTPNAYDAGDKIYKGDLQMRATVVYHYNAPTGNKGSQQTPIACISSYYDPTNADTAQNAAGLPQNPTQIATLKGVSNNGIAYPVSVSRAVTPVLRKQANMLFPNGRWANEPLKKAVDKLDGGKTISDLTLEEVAAIDAANCALSILYTPTSFATNSYVPNFAIQERAFLDARQVKALHKSDTDEAGNTLKVLSGAAVTNITRETKLDFLTDPAKMKIAELGELATLPTAPETGALTPPPYYSVPVEQRQPLEIRVTEIDLGDKVGTYPTGFRKTSAGTVNGNQEYMLPNSGIIYATRDDALLDISDTEFDSTKPNYGQDKGGSATDFKLDPTRRPTGIRLVNGKTLAREDNYRAAEKGLILASNLPVYIKGEFNLHIGPDGTVREEFTDPLDLSDYSNFYTRGQSGNAANGYNKDYNFACRPNASNPGKCTNGDRWRAARILADAVTLLSGNFRDGYRTEGDYDVNNNIGNLAVATQLKNGFYWNSFATSAQWYEPTTGIYPKDFDTSAAATGIQGSSYATNGVTPVQRRTTFPEYRMEICRKLPVSACGPQDWKLETPDPGNAATLGKIGSGTTAPISDTQTDIHYVPIPDRIYPRRLAFKRNPDGTIDMPKCDVHTTGQVNCRAIPIGVSAANANVELVYNGMDKTYTPPAGTTVNDDLTALRSATNALWYWTTKVPTNPSGVATSTNLINPAQDVSYNTGKLYYFPDEPEVPAVVNQNLVHERQLLLPGAPELPEALFPGAKIPANQLSLNGETQIDPSDFGVCTTQGWSMSYKVSSLQAAPCQILAVENVRKAWLDTSKLPETADIPSASVHAELIQAPPVPPNPPPAAITLTAKAKYNIYTLATSPSDIKANVRGQFTLDPGSQQDPVFVFRTQPTATQGINFVGFTLTLNGVDPNNVLWVSTGGVYFNDSVANTVAGTFVGAGSLVPAQAPFVLYGGDSTTPKLQIQGGRILGFAGLFYGNTSTPLSLSTVKITALTAANQPLLVPVAQLHSPQGAPSNAAGTAFGGVPINSNYWVQRVPSDKTETYNAVFVMGDSPSRPFPNNPANLGESGGGLGNFPRFLEVWHDTGNDDDAASKGKTRIVGSFIQFKKSLYATAPFEQVDDPAKDNSLFFDGAMPDYNASFAPATGKPYIYKGGASGRKAMYYRPPQRLWGYDVGLLSQSADLFSRRFANPTAGTPNEYYREVSRDDAWIQTLLCAAEPTTGTNYDWAITDPKQRPTSCQTAAPGADYRS